MMKKLNTILMISALLLSISVQSAPVKSIESEGAKVSFLMIVGMIAASAAVGVAGVGTLSLIGHEKGEKKRIQRQRDQRKKFKKAVMAAIRIRAEAEYARRHTRHWH
jgi:hypothetical protein